MSNHIANSLLNFKRLLSDSVKLIAVSKTKPISDIKAAYDAGQRHFGENKAQEVIEKAPALPTDIHWHFIGHLQRKKVKQIIEYTHLIHSIDSLQLLEEVNKRAKNISKIQNVLLQIHIAEEDSKFGLNESELKEIIPYSIKNLSNIRIIGLMGMATFSDDELKISSEFHSLNQVFTRVKNSYFTDSETFKELSMGMSGDYKIAILNGSTMIRVGSSIFGKR